MKPHKKICVVTLGCSKNTVDSEVLMKQLKENNLLVTQNINNNADVIILNTCGFIKDAKQESIQAIFEAIDLKKQGKVKNVVVMGCLSERYQNVLRHEIPEIDIIIGANKIEQVVSAIGAEYKCEFIGERILTTPKHYAYLKISEGCDRLCSFCAIPLMRGKHKSKPIKDLIIETEKLAEQGVKELILIAQDSTYYGIDLYGRRSLSSLLEKLCQIKGIEWIRLMYAYPLNFPSEVLDIMQEQPKMCKYLDIPVQHISDTVLKSMRRGMSSASVQKLIEKIRLKVPGIALRTTLIVGYPTEGEKEFNELISFVRETKFDRLGVFTYSQEENTDAYSLGDPVPDEVKELRRSIIMEEQQKISHKKNQKLIGKKLKVIVDSQKGNIAFARTESDAPEIDNEVMVHSTNRLAVGEFYDVSIVSADAYDLFAIHEDGMKSTLQKVGQLTS